MQCKNATISLDLGGRLNKILRLSHGSDPIDRSNDIWKVGGLLGLIATPARDKIHLLVLLGGSNKIEKIGYRHLPTRNHKRQ
jgi:hypothetical protein